MTLEYWREYRTYFHLGKSWGITESTTCRIIQKVERMLSLSRTFSLPRKKQLINNETATETVVIDVTQTPIECPKKNKKDSTVDRINGILNSRKSS